MESVINKLAEIETAATKIMQAAENQKKLQDEQQEERIAKFDADLEAETAKRIEVTRRTTCFAGFIDF